MHGPYDLPQYAYSHEITQAGESSMFKSFTMTAITILARSNVQNMSPERRKCRLDFNTERCFLASVKLDVFLKWIFRYFDESNLSRFPVYSYDLCKLDCKINIIVKKFGCVPFFYKKLPHEEDCNHFQLVRIFRVFDRNFSIPESSLSKWLQQIDCLSEDIERAIQSCKCPVTCENVKFGRRDSETIYWIKNNTFRLELMKPKTRVIRENLYSLTDIMSKSNDNN